LANRRMFSLKIVDTDAFLDMPQTAQLLYYSLAMRADDDGFVSNPKKVMRMIGSQDDDYKLLILKKFIIPFDSGVCVIKHWLIHNLIRGDRYMETQYVREKSMLVVEDKTRKYSLRDNSGMQDVIPEVIPNTPETLPQGSVVKDSLDKVSKVKTLPSEEDVDLARYLELHIRRNLPNFKKPDITKWADEIRKLREIDKRTPEQIKYVITWCQKDSFWKANILSTATLRKQWDKLEARIRSEASNKPKVMNFDA
jgi:hypothetical protein